MKKELHNICLDLIHQKTVTLQSIIDELKLAIFHETKSTAGDKHETGRAMAQIELENHYKQLEALLKIKESLDIIDPTQTFSIIKKGSLVLTSEGYFYIAIGLGKVEFQGETVFVTSDSSPIAKILLGCKNDS